METRPVPIPDKVNIPLQVDQLRVAGILDELSEKFFPYECKFVNLNAAIWKEQITELNPHFLFVESVWNGYQKTWRGKFSPRISPEISQLVNWCKERRIPTLFWNKEDPIHMFTFLGAAFLFDFVFTTDMDCVPLYKRLLGHNRVGVLPFAAAVQLFHPIETYNRKDAACFAGSYYARREERRQDFENIADVLIENYALDIYDRNPYPDNPDYTFPMRFQSHIKGSLPVDEIDIAYKSYKLGITLNIVKHSSTMEARRIFELLSCNTLTASNPCLGIKNLFGDLVLYSDDSVRFAQQIKTVLGSESIYQRMRLLALRKTLQEHTYKERLEYLYSKVFGMQPQSTAPKIAVIAVVETQQELERVQAAFDRQNYPDKQLFLFASSQNLASLSAAGVLHSLENFHPVLAGSFDYYACFSPRNYYGVNYLVDLALATRYASVSVIGKSAHFAWLETGLDSGQEGGIQYQKELGAYYQIDRLQADRSMFAPHLLKSIEPTSLAGGLWFEHLPCLSIDAYNFCENFPGETCAEVDDLQVNSGISMPDLYRISDSLTPEIGNYKLGKVVTGQDLCQNVNSKNNNFRFELLPLNYFGFFSLGNAAMKVFIGEDVSLQDVTFTDELTGKQVLPVYINGQTEGVVTFHVNYYSENGDAQGGYIAANRACVTIPVPGQAQYCKLSITTHGTAHGLVKEVFFGPRVLHALDLETLEASG